MAPHRRLTRRRRGRRRNEFDDRLPRDRRMRAFRPFSEVALPGLGRLEPLRARPGRALARGDDALAGSGGVRAAGVTFEVFLVRGRRVPARRILPGGFLPAASRRDAGGDE